jgi:hypothetical protein
VVEYYPAGWLWAANPSIHPNSAPLSVWHCLLSLHPVSHHLVGALSQPLRLLHTVCDYI